MNGNTIEDHQTFTPHERLFGNLSALKEEIKVLESKLKGLNRLVDDALSWRKLVVDIDEETKA